MRTEKYTFANDGFSGELMIPDEPDKKCVIVFAGSGEKYIRPEMIGRVFADNGFAALSVDLFGKEGLPCCPSEIPLEMAEKAIDVMKSMGYKIALYGMSMGTVIAAYAAVFIEDISDVILVSPCHVSFEGGNKKEMTGHGLVTWRGIELPFVSADYAGEKTFAAFESAYNDKEREADAAIPVERMKSRVLILASKSDEVWPSCYSAKYLEKRLEASNYPYKYETIIYINSGHIIGIFPKRKMHPLLFALLPFAYISERQAKGCKRARKNSEDKIFSWLREQNHHHHHHHHHHHNHESSS